MNNFQCKPRGSNQTVANPCICNGTVRNASIKGSQISFSPVEASIGFSFESVAEFESAVFARMSNGWRKSAFRLPFCQDAPLRTQFSKRRFSSAGCFSKSSAVERLASS